jgi:putative addiction module component (TIGR02574 family)
MNVNTEPAFAPTRIPKSCYYLSMNVSPESIRDLTAQQRLDAIALLWESLEENEMPLTEAQATELDRRLGLHQQNPNAVISWQDFELNLQ